ncbi:HlyD family type I secretion periplasmic adaptor subunit [Magnetospirillum sp. SS-4]|uniref:HlyD family type I secretion periplasmic adaptor subunit n=1 Tax=Magnetospirillum sp. SS-4 TaxID=2681465 RepID=UPI001382F62B|nr:HlyD family type I secretion periplasmic adaptor subunit [Magnetospirillum sp. SS-4]CAA7619036.1 Type I secretion membrane fusion protein, HlyD [Magnetospirillum sp. SS-4]
MHERLQAIKDLIEAWADHPRVRAAIAYLTAADSPELAQVQGERRLVRLAALTMLLFIAWAALFDLDIAANAPGKVVPAGQIKRIQHLEGGIVRQIHVKEGDIVSIGQPLVELESTASEADLQEIEARIGTLKINTIRLQAQLDGAKELKFPLDLKDAYPEQVKSARALFLAQQDRLTSAVSEQELKIKQREAELAEIRTRLGHSMGRHKILSEQLAINQKLLSQGLMNEYEHLELRKEEQSLRGGIAESRASINRLEAALDQERVALQSLRFGENEQLRKELGETSRELTEFSERVRKFADSRARTTIRAPINGAVMTLYVVTEGGVVAPGGTVLSMVPGGDRLMVEARLPVGEVGFLRPGQRARLQLVSSSGRGFRPLDGKVIQISPDSIAEQDQEPFYLVRIAPAADAFVDDAVRYPLRPGVEVETSILTGRRSVLKYVLDPFIGGLSNGLSER